jgi:hypothetical protein
MVTVAEKPAGEDKNWETVGEQFTEIFIKHPDNVGIVLSFLDEYSFRVRWPAVKLLANLVTNKYVEMHIVVLTNFLLPNHVRLKSFVGLKKFKK